jgi:hypothetical protein
MATFNLELEDIQNLGEVSEPQDRPPCEPFSGVDPYPVDPSSFYEDKGFPDNPLRFRSLMDAVAEEAAEMGVDVDFEGIVLEENDRSCPNSPCDYCDSLWLADHPNCETDPCAVCREVDVHEPDCSCYQCRGNKE